MSIAAILLAFSIGATSLSLATSEVTGTQMNKSSSMMSGAGQNQSKMMMGTYGPNITGSVLKERPTLSIGLHRII